MMYILIGPDLIYLHLTFEDCVLQFVELILQDAISLQEYEEIYLDKALHLLESENYHEAWKNHLIYI